MRRALLAAAAIAAMMGTARAAELDDQSLKSAIRITIWYQAMKACPDYTPRKDAKFYRSLAYKAGRGLDEMQSAAIIVAAAHKLDKLIKEAGGKDNFCSLHIGYLDAFVAGGK
jgi:hypothetical protein